MKATSHEIDALDDVRVLILSRAQGPFGQDTARKHANMLMQRAMQAFKEGNVAGAIRLTAREFDFNCRAFGFSHAYTLSSKACLAALKQHYSNEAWRTQVSSMQLKLEKRQSKVVGLRVS
jgi:hypothetical protein